MNKKIIFSLVLSSVVLLLSCNYNKEELPLPEEVVEPTVTITYTNYVKRIIDENHCLECHISGGTAAFRDYTTYNGIKNVAISGTLKDRAIDGVQPTMPYNYPELSQSIKDTLQIWIDQGALE